MTTSAAADIEKIQTPTAEEKTREVKHGLAADLIERGLQSRSDELLITLLMITDSELLADGYSQASERLYQQGDELLSRLRDVFPKSRSGDAAHLYAKCRTLSDEVDLYRQEHFWLKSGGASLSISEEMIRLLFRFYASAEELMRDIDQSQPEYEQLFCEAVSRGSDCGCHSAVAGYSCHDRYPQSAEFRAS